MFLEMDKNIFKDILNMTKNLEVSLIIEGWDHSYNIPTLFFENGSIRLIIIVSNERGISFPKYSGFYYALLDAILKNNKSRIGNKESFGIQKMINLDQAIKLIALQEHLNIAYIYNNEGYQRYYEKDIFNLQKDIKDFIEKIKEGVLRKI